MKKLLKIGMLASAALPIATIISCGSETTNNTNNNDGGTATAAKFEDTSFDNVDTVLKAALNAPAATPNIDKFSVTTQSGDTTEFPVFNLEDQKTSVKILSGILKDLTGDDTTKNLVGINTNKQKLGIMAKQFVDSFNKKGYAVIDVTLGNSSTNKKKQYGLVVQKTKLSSLKTMIEKAQGQRADAAYAGVFSSITQEPREITDFPDNSTLTVKVTELNAKDNRLGNVWAADAVNKMLFEVELQGNPVANQTQGILLRFSNLHINGQNFGLTTSAAGGGFVGKITSAVSSDNAGVYSWT